MTDEDQVVAEVIQALTPPPPVSAWEALKTELENQFVMESTRLDHMFDALRHVPLP